MPFYDMVCTGCAYFAKDQHYKSFDAFEKADKTCPDCKESQLERAAAQLFNAGRKNNPSKRTYKTESGNVVSRNHEHTLAVCVEGRRKGELAAVCVERTIVQKDPGLN